jgi:hypothetical protein
MKPLASCVTQFFLSLRHKHRDCAFLAPSAHEFHCRLHTPTCLPLQKFKTLLADFSLNAPLLDKTEHCDAAADGARPPRPSHLSKFFFGWCRPFIVESRGRLLEVSKL